MKIPEVAEAVAQNDFKRVRDVITSQREGGIFQEDIAETVVAEAQARIDNGDLTGADAVLFHAVHAHIRPYLLFTECKKLT